MQSLYEEDKENGDAAVPRITSKTSLPTILPDVNLQTVVSAHTSSAKTATTKPDPVAAGNLTSLHTDCYFAYAKHAR
jgi:hypothetical protein